MAYERRREEEMRFGIQRRDVLGDGLLAFQHLVWLFRCRFWGPYRWVQVLKRAIGDSSRFGIDPLYNYFSTSNAVSYIQSQ